MAAQTSTMLHEKPLASVNAEIVPERDEVTPSSKIVIGDVEQYDGRVVLYVIKGTCRREATPHANLVTSPLITDQRTKHPTSTT
jgi:hypothetical protein